MSFFHFFATYLLTYLSNYCITVIDDRPPINELPFAGSRDTFRHVPRLSKKSFVGFHMARDEGRPLATSSLAVGRYAAKIGSQATCSKSNICLV